MGKTSVALTVADRLLYDSFEVSKVLVIAPLRVAEDTWSRESEKHKRLGFWPGCRLPPLARVYAGALSGQYALFSL